MRAKFLTECHPVNFRCNARYERLCAFSLPVTDCQHCNLFARHAARPALCSAAPRGYRGCVTQLPSLADALREAAARLDAVSETARLDAEFLAAHALGLERMAMLARLRDLDAPAGYEALIARRLAHEPVAYITGRQEFYDIALAVTPDVLIPRSDSETLIDAAKAYFDRKLEPEPKTVSPEPVEGRFNAEKRASTGSALAVNGNTPKRILDLGTGSGALLLQALTSFGAARGIGVDASAAALKVASGNAEALALSDRADFLHLDWREAGWVEALDGPFDLILCNPPYVEEGAELAPMVAEYEPAAALFAGADGLSDYRLLLPAIAELLAPGGIACFEIGATQAGAVADLAAESGLGSRLHHDLAGKPRCLQFSRRRA